MLGLDLEALIRAVGYLGLFVIVFAETGLLVGFLLPGDSLLFTAGLLASQDVISLGPLVIVCFVAAVAGDATGYAFGRHVGRALFERQRGRLFRQEYLRQAEEFFERRGGWAIVAARFVPVARTMVPIVAGAGSMEYSRFTVFNVLGGLLWAVGLPVAGYFFGSTIPGVDRYLLPIILVIVVLGNTPHLIHLWHRRNLKCAGRSLGRTEVRGADGATVVATSKPLWVKENSASSADRDS